jgi:hypothetical protein
MMKFRSLFSIVAVCVAVYTASVAGMLPSTASANNASQVPTVVTDKDDYMPGETVYITGAGFWPGEPVDLSIAVEGEDGTWVPDVDWTIEFADENGGFETTYVVPEHWADRTLRLTAMGYSSGLVATTTFRDSVTSVTINSPTTAAPVTVTSLPATINVAFNYVTTTPSPPVSVTAVITIGPPGNPIATKTVTGLPQGNYSRTEAVTIPAGTPNGSYQVRVEITHASGNPQSRTATQNNAVIISVLPPNTPPTLTVTNPNITRGHLCNPTRPSTTVTVTPADFGASASDAEDGTLPVTFDDGSTSKTVTLTLAQPSATLTLKAEDSGGLMATATVTVTAEVENQPVNNPPSVTAQDRDLGHICVGTGNDDLTYQVTVTPADFNPVYSDPDGDPQAGPTTFGDGSTSMTVTLTLPAGVASQTVEVPVTLKVCDDPSGRNEPDCEPMQSLCGETTVYVRATLHRNNPPTITASNANLGPIVGCLVGGSFQTTQPISLETFDASATDPEGDPVLLSIQGDLSELTFVGPGVVTLPVTLVATDDPSGRTNGTCEPMTSTMTVYVSVQVVYNFVGFFSPLDTTRATIVKRGSTVPVKFQLYDCDGNQITTGQHRISVDYLSGASPYGTPEVTDAGSSNDNTWYFRYSDGQWIYNLKTNTSYSLNSTYIIRAHLDDGTTHEVHISIKR